MYVSARVPDPENRKDRGSPLLFYPNPQFESSDPIPDPSTPAVSPTVYNFKLRFGCGSTVNLDDVMDDIVGTDDSVGDDEDYFEHDGSQLLKPDVPTEVSILLQISNFFSSIMRMTKCK